MSTCFIETNTYLVGPLLEEATALTENMHSKILINPLFNWCRRIEF